MEWRDIPSLSALKAFEATARLGSFTKAAAELNVTHAAIAQHVRGLERDLVEQLVIRQPRGMALTPAGAQLADDLRSGLQQIINAIKRLQLDRQNRPLTVSLTPSFAAQWLMPCMGEFWQTYPQILVNLSPNTEMVDLERDGIDLAIRFGSGTWNGLDATPLTSGRFVVVAKPDLIADRKVTCLSDVADLPFLLDHYVMEHRALIESQGIDLDAIDTHFFASNELVDAGLHAGIGVSVRTSTLVEGDIKSGRLVKICDLEESNLGYFIVHPKGRLSENAKVFKRWLKKIAKRGA